MAVVPENLILLMHVFRYAKNKVYLDDSNEMKKEKNREDNCQRWGSTI